MASASVPAWKRLGLKLKYADQDAPDNGEPINLPRRLSAAGAEIRKSPPMVQTEPSEPLKKKRKTEKHVTPTTQVQESNMLSDQNLASALDRDQANGSRPKKQVSFSSDTKALDSPIHQGPSTDSAGPQKPKAKSKSKTKSKSKSKPAKGQVVGQQSHPALEYLSQYHSARSTWKFSKNRETWLLKHIFSATDVPRAYEIPLARYIHGLQGVNARERLRTESEKQLKNDASSTNGESGAQRDLKKDEEYQMRFLQDLEGEASQASALERIGEGDEYSHWIQQQPRAKIVLWALGSPIPRAETDRPVSSAPNIKERKRKNRTTVIEYDSSSSSSSSSDSGSDSDIDSTSSDDTSSQEGDTSSSDEDSSDG